MTEYKFEKSIDTCCSEQFLEEGRAAGHELSTKMATAEAEYLSKSFVVEIFAGPDTTAEALLSEITALVDNRGKVKTIRNPIPLGE